MPRGRIRSSQLVEKPKEDLPAHKKNPVLDNVKTLSFKHPSPMKDEYKFYQCKQCWTKVSIHTRALEANMVRFQLHVISHFKDLMFSDVPSLPSYYCPHPGEKCQKQLTNKITFLCHLALVHNEFLPRIKRILEDSMGQKVAYVSVLEDVVDNLNSNPFLKIDPTSMPSVDDVTDEISIYKAYELHTTDLVINCRCTTCGEPFKNPDFAVLHTFMEHKMSFKHISRIPTKPNVRLRCSCKFTTYSKSEYIAHMGHFHNRFEDIYAQIRETVDGVASMFDLFTSTRTKLTEEEEKKSINLFTFSSTQLGVTYDCGPCKVFSLPHTDLKPHLVLFDANHPKNKPIILKCRDCETSLQVQHLPKEEKLLQHRCNFEDVVQLVTQDVRPASKLLKEKGKDPLETIHVVFLEDRSEEGAPSEVAVEEPKHKAKKQASSLETNGVGATPEKRSKPTEACCELIEIE